jgi:hypothetical protein
VIFDTGAPVVFDAIGGGLVSAQGCSTLDTDEL